jgi:hypothetical protein
VARLGGVNAIAVKESVQELDPFWSAGLRFAAAGLLLVALALASRRSFPRGRGFGGAVGYLVVLGSIVMFGLYLARPQPPLAPIRSDCPCVPRRPTACRDRRRSDGQVLGLTVGERLDA